MLVCEQEGGREILREKSWEIHYKASVYSACNLATHLWIGGSLSTDATLCFVPVIRLRFSDTNTSVSSPAFTPSPIMSSDPTALQVAIKANACRIVS